MVLIHGPLGYEPNTLTTAPLRCLMSCALTRILKQKCLQFAELGYEGGSGRPLGVHACAHIAFKLKNDFKIDVRT